MEITIAIIYSTIHALTPLLIAGIGELISEKSGTLNLGIEGMMLMGCISGFIMSLITGSILIGFIMAALTGMMLASLFAFFVLILRANQVVFGLSLTIFCTGLSAFLGQKYIGVPLDGLSNINIYFLSDLPIIGKLLFSHDLLVYLAFVLLFASQYFLYHSHAGLILRAVGENHDVAHAFGYSVIKIRFYALMFGGAMAGIAGAYLSLVYTPLWAENMTSGRGWIVLALVIFSMWRPYRLLFGAFLFGFASIAQLFLQVSDSALQIIPTEFFTMLPYLATLIALVFISSRKSK